MVHAVKALLIRGTSILLTAYTNSAVDNLLIKLKAQVSMLALYICQYAYMWYINDRYVLKVQEKAHQWFSIISLTHLFMQKSFGFAAVSE